MRLSLSVLLFISCFAAKAQYQVHVEDVQQFWKMYDSLQHVTDSAEQVKLIQTKYIDKGTEGLKEFNAVRDGNAVNYQKFIKHSKERFQKIRPYTLSVLDQKMVLDKKLERFKQLYPKLKVGDVYFTIGIGNSGGTTQGSHVLIGCEVAAGPSPEWAVGLVLHEFVHTQQQMDTVFNLLSHTILEGAAEFIMELVNEGKIPEISPRGYIAYGLMNEKETWQKFKTVMFASDDNTLGWMYGDPGVEIAGIHKVDMAYYMGYRICKSYYDHAKDKSKAIADIIELPYKREDARKFVLPSGYVPKQDIAFVTNTPFKKYSIAKQSIAKKIYGVMQDKDNVIFQYNAPAQLMKGYIDSVMLAGSFNDWNNNNSNYKMNNKGNGKFELKIPKSEFKKETAYTFKFVINGNEWLLAPVYASNNDGSDNKNLVFKVN